MVTDQSDRKNPNPRTSSTKNSQARFSTSTREVQVNAPGIPCWLECNDVPPSR